MRIASYSLIILTSVIASAQDKAAQKYAETITAKDLKTHLSVLASDEYEGRETGKNGQKWAAKYISEHFKKLDLEAPVQGSYFQRFDLLESGIGSVYLRKGQEEKKGFEDFLYYSKSETMGEEYVRFLMASPELENQGYHNSYVVFVVKEFGGFQEFVERAEELGAKGFVLIMENEAEYNSVLSRFGPFIQRPSLRARDNNATKLIVGNQQLAEWIFGKAYHEIKEGDSELLIFNADYLDKPIETENVLGFLEGKEKPDEILVITAHYDHIGIINGQVNNGADDDGSGTAAVLELAEAFAEAAKKRKRPKRSILFMTVTGEEKGLLGSKHYTDTDPIFPLESTVANLNIDMIGRVDPSHEGNRNYVYLIGSDKLSTELHDLSEEVNSTYTNLELDYTYNDEDDPNRFYFRSDHYNFAKNNVPIIFYFNGTHPDYHRPSDTIDKISFDLLESRTKLVFHTAWEIANREKRIRADKVERAEDGNCSLWGLCPTRSFQPAMERKTVKSIFLQQV